VSLAQLGLCFPDHSTCAETVERIPADSEADIPVFTLLVESRRRHVLGERLETHVAEQSH